jgi:hypothetical protein
MAELDQMPPQWCQRLKLPLSANYAAGAAALRKSLVDQTSLPWPDEFPLKTHASEKTQTNNCRSGSKMPTGSTGFPQATIFRAAQRFPTWEQLGLFPVDFIDYSRAHESI